MPLTMPQPSKHSKSGVYRLALTVPKDLQGTAKSMFKAGTKITVSLETKDRRTANTRAAAALVTLQAKLDAIRAAHTGIRRTLSHQEVVALAGAWYSQQARQIEANPGEADFWTEYQHQQFDAAGAVPGEEFEYHPDEAALADAARILAGQHIAAAPESVHALAVALWDFKLKLADLMTRRAKNDYGPDIVAASIPPLPVSVSPAVTIDDLVTDWARHNDKTPGMGAKGIPVDRAWYDRHRTATRLAAFLGHQDARRVTKADAVAWKASFDGKKASTIANDISEMSALWRVAIKNGKLALNPFEGILPAKKARNRKATKRPFDDAETKAILAAARGQRGALRWVPWVLCFTGARLSEVMQATKADLVTRDGMPFLRIHDDDEQRATGEGKRSVKNEGSIRMVPIHPALAKEGFLDYVAALPAKSSLWPDIEPDALFGSRGTAAQRIIRRWLRVAERP